MIKLELTEEMVNSILQILGQAAYNVSAPIINEIVSQAQPQVDSKEDQ